MALTLYMFGRKVVPSFDIVYHLFRFNCIVEVRTDSRATEGTTHRFLGQFVGYFSSFVSCRCVLAIQPLYLNNEVICTTLCVQNGRKDGAWPVSATSMAPFGRT